MATTPLPPSAAEPAPESVGSAYMKPDGTLEMHLRTQTRDGTIGEALLVIKPDDPRYAGMVAHLSGIEPGQGRKIPPFPAPDAAA